jgi:predicted nucleic acid-binding protein
LEIFTILSQKAGKKKAIEFGRMIKEQNPFLIKRINEDLEEKTWKVFEKIKEKDLSYVDCSIIAVIIDGGYQLATFDKKILKLQEQFGFKIFP